MTVTSTVGTSSRNYSTLAAWIAGLPATLTDHYRAELYNDTEFLNQTGATLTGVNTNGFSITITTATGQSFRDHATAATNPLRYDQTKGVGIRTTGNYTINSPISVNAVKNVTISGLQLKHPVGYGTCLIHQNSVNGDGAGDNFVMSNCLLEGLGGVGGQGTGVFSTTGYSQGNKLTNTVVISTSSTGTGVMVQNAMTNSIDIRFCTIVCSATTNSSGALKVNYNTLPVKNSAFFGFGSVKISSGTPTYTNCATDVASPPSGVAQFTYANQFQNITTAAMDFRAKTGAGLIGAGVADATYTTDIIGQTRASPPTIGAWEVVSSGTTGTFSATTAAATLAAAGSSVSAVFSATTAAATLAATGSSVRAVLAATTATATLAASGTQTTTGALAATTAAASLAAAGSSTAGAFAATTAPATLSAAGSATASGVVGAFSATNAVPTLAAAASSVTGTLSGTTPAAALASSGTQTTTSAFSATTVAPTLVATGSSVRGVLAATTAVPTLAAAAASTRAVFAATTPAATLAAAGTQATTGTFAATTLPPPILLARGLSAVTQSADRLLSVPGEVRRTAIPAELRAAQIAAERRVTSIGLN